MHFLYFDETKFDERESRFFFAGGLVLRDKDLQAHEATLAQIQQNFFGTSILTRQTEMHGKDIFHGKGQFKGRKLRDRLKLLADIANFIITAQLPVRIVQIDIPEHRAKYRFPQPEYHLGLMLLLERYCDYLDQVDDLGLVFGDYEKDEITRAVLDFSQFKIAGSTPMNRGRPLGRLVDTIYFTHSHHSRFLQAADVMLYMATRCESRAASDLDKHHEQELRRLWGSIKAGGQVKIQRWP
ncbi:MAG: DUF3800 domain-containing protein [Verrucomicrobiae bacterium]|nr:DUF3800 domain-containing protein [Verrucomicrobiae bacterium]